ncbi:uncharacterized protein N7511_010265 [Penicillium nucicola]|uniref:uncharacterized protein n=1 Tax=Penicillium nucicola TaxID=1850975 RepID=UPI002545028A|nr:uncharacterized protein N7511_010265 [Penicillium nucicola]KAJ5748569.1 hypothetical protein N7511_010265 [Penicillium nucicola]
MSADLLAEFGQAPAPASGSSGQQNQKTSFFDDLNQENIDFFGAPASVLQHTKAADPIPKTAGNHSAVQPPWGSHSQPQFDLPLNKNSDVLFDTAFDAPGSDADDDWGDFEGPESTSQQAPRPTAPSQPSSVAAFPRSLGSTPLQDASGASGAVDLLETLSIGDTAPIVNQETKTLRQKQLSQPNQPKSQPKATWDDDSFGDWGEFTDAPASKPPPKVSVKKAKPPVKPHKASTSTWDDDAFDDWGDFTDGPSASPAPKFNTPSPTVTSPVSSPTVRPTNIPPPSVLLELFLDVFENLQKEATQVKSQLRSSPSNRTNLSATASHIHNALESAARVIAGRSLRWKRDTILSQSMRIGPARAGKTGGMKLNSVNKHENIKEEQDAVNVLNLWRERAAIFNTVLQAAGQRPIPAVPDPGALKVIVARSDQGALKASHSCALCALKRDERVLRVDESDVQDSFGEWWTEHWGHTHCRQFWETNLHLLGQR